MGRSSPHQTIAYTGAHRLLYNVIGGEWLTFVRSLSVVSSPLCGVEGDTRLMAPQTEYTPLLLGIGIGGYRSLGAVQQFVFDTKVTLLAGVNNSGKSNVLRFLTEVLPKLQLVPNTAKFSARSFRETTPLLAEDDHPKGLSGAGTPQRLTIGRPIAIEMPADSVTASTVAGRSTVPDVPSVTDPDFYRRTCLDLPASSEVTGLRPGASDSETRAFILAQQRTSWWPT